MKTTSKYILITGSNGNLGQAVCNLSLEAGYNVIGTFEPGDKIEAKNNIEYFEVDLTSDTQASDFINTLKNTREELHAVILLVGGFAMSNIFNTTTDDLMDMYELNFLTVFNCIKPTYKWMKDTGGGKIVVVGAKPALEGGASEVLPYALAKGSVIQLAEILNETGKKDNIVVSTIIPSIIDTPPNREAMPNANFSDWVTPENVAGNILHLISKEATDLRDPVLKLYGNVL